MVLRTIPLRALVSRAELGLEVRAGKSRLDRPVCWAHVSELRDPVPYLLGQELLLTAGVNFPRTPAEIDAYVESLVNAGVTALGFGMSPVYDAVPKELVKACRDRDLPLLAVPERTPFLAVSQAVGNALAEAQNVELRVIADGQRNLTRAATRPRPIETTVRALATSLTGWAMLLDSEGTVVTRSGLAPEPSDDLLSLASRLRGGSGPRSASTHLGGDHVVLYPVDLSCVLVVGRNRAFSVGDRAVVAMALAMIGLLRRETDTSRGHASRLSARLLLAAGSAAESTGDLLAALLDNRAGQDYRVLAGVDVRHGQRTDLDSDFAQLVQLLGTPLVDLAGGSFRAIVAARSAPSPTALDTLHKRGWLVGMSGVVGVADLRTAEREAVALRRRAAASGHPVSADNESESVSSLIDPAQARAFARRTLAPLTEIRSPGPGQLVETLRVWLANHGNWDRSATALDVHRNSVRHRIGQIERALHVDLSQAQHRMDLWYAVNWLPQDWPGGQ
ncbi:PucR family transcriptional regulator [Kibdelosporangium persicum]|uniref:DNA-binding PucR family transcriptional regulator n=1 Tax=Kibdelosporangium persicum TaxID=2698649 RepID=A0ABX2EZ58_9PSEU|nr:PucR family transcriptional regulator [Kibdelosporangium persicum]NRN64314.1 DNA-binding PucR family transcriptional regulator [Kibdelosporangium persicum]